MTYKLIFHNKPVYIFSEAAYSIEFDPHCYDISNVILYYFNVLLI